MLSSPLRRSWPATAVGTVDGYRHDLRGFFRWAADNGIRVLEATRPHVELFRSWMDDRGLAASTIDRRLSTVCGFYRFAHIDGRIGSNPAQYVRRPQVHPSEARGLDHSELGVFLFTAEQYDRDHAALAVLGGQTRRRSCEERRSCPTSCSGVYPSHTAGWWSIAARQLSGNTATRMAAWRRAFCGALLGQPPRRRARPEPSLGAHATTSQGGG